MPLRTPGRLVAACLTAWLVAIVPTAPAGAQASLYDRLGGKPAIEALVDTLVTRLKTDPRTAVAFAGNDPARMRERLGAQFCDRTGGPCETINPDMRKVHSALDITPADFDAFIAIVGDSLAAIDVPAALRGEVLDRFRPMREDIVNAR